MSIFRSLSRSISRVTSSPVFRQVAPLALPFLGPTGAALSLIGQATGRFPATPLPTTRTDIAAASFWPEVAEGAGTGAVAGLPGGWVGAGIGGAVGAGVAAVQQIAKGDYPFTGDEEEYADEGDFQDDGDIEEDYQ